MAKYRESYIHSHCIDLFFSYNGLAIHIMTDGNEIPDSLNDIERNRDIQRIVAIQSENQDVNQEQIIINPSILKYISSINTDGNELPDRELMLGMFLPIAEMGFNSYDCVGIDENGRGKYILVARPANNPAVNIEVPSFDGVEQPEYQKDILVAFRM